MTFKEIPRPDHSEWLYGIVIDTGRPREDGGVPVFFDGWYSERHEVVQALNCRLEQSPGAFGYIVRQEVFQTGRLAREREPA